MEGNRNSQSSRRPRSKGLLLLMAGLWLGGCAGPQWVMEQLMHRDEGGVPPATTCGAWISETERELAQEITGSDPAADTGTWEEYWRARYEAARTKGDPELADFCVRYIKTRRQQMGLPLYDDQACTPAVVILKDATCYFENSIIAAVETEKRGAAPPACAQGWTEYWLERYAQIDRYTDGELASAHRRIIHKHRDKAGLPLEDPLLAGQ